MDYLPTEKMCCDIFNKPKQRAPYRLDHSHLMNVHVDYVDKVDCKATHPALLYTNHYNEIKVLPRNHDIIKADSSLVRRSMLGIDVK